MKSLKSETVKLKAKRTFMKKGSCSRTFFYLLDREFGFPMDEKEKAIDPMAGGILQQGYSVGYLLAAVAYLAITNWTRSMARTPQSPDIDANGMQMAAHTITVVQRSQPSITLAILAAAKV